MHMADRLEALARDVRSFAEEDSDLALQMAAEVRADHLAAQVEAARLREVEARVEETERRRRAEVEARREVERREEREEQARLAEDARRAAGIRASNSEERDSSRGPSVQFLAKRERARLQAEKLPTLFDLDALPDEVAGAVLRQMGAYELAATSCCDKRFRDLARTDDALWRRLQLTCGRHPRWRVDGSWRESFFQGAEKIDANWRRGKFRRLEHRLHSEYTACVAMRGDLGCSGSADHDLAIFGLPPRARGTPLQGVGLLWERQIGRCVGHGEPVTCCKLAGGDGDDAFSPPTLALSGTAKGEMRVWSLSQMPTCPWRAEEDETWGDMATPGAHDTATPRRVPCVETRLLTTPETGQPHAQFFDVTAGCSLGGNGGDGGSFGLVAAAGAEHGAGVHVYDTARWGAACVRVPGFDAGVYGIAWGRGPFDNNVVHAACSDGIVRRWDVRAPGRGARLDAARVGESTGRNRRVARCVDADGGLFAFGSASGTVHVHDARVPNAPLASPKRAHSDCVNAVAIDAKLGRVVSGGDDCGIAVQRLPLTLEDAQVTFAQTPQGVLGVAFDHSRLVIGCEDTTVRVFDAELGEGFVDGEALRQAMRELNRRTQGAGSILHRARRITWDGG